MAESVLLIIAVVLMIIAIIASFLPVVPGPAIVWAIGVLFAGLTEFRQVTVLSVALMTILMILGSTTGWWMQALGMKAQGGSCIGVAGALLGGLIGTFAIPIPFLGTLIGIVLGTLVVEFAHVGEFRQALQSGNVAIKSYLLSVVVEIGISTLILAVFSASVLFG